MRGVAGPLPWLTALLLAGCSAVPPLAGALGDPSREPAAGSPTASPEPATSVAPTPDRWTVSALLAAREAGNLEGGPIVLEGYWSNPSAPHSCGAPQGSPGELEIYCRDGEFGITERNE